MSSDYELANVGDPIETRHIVEAVARAAIEAYRLSDALSRVEREARALRAEVKDWKRIAEGWRETHKTLKDAYGAAVADLEREQAESRRAWAKVEKLERKLAKANARNRSAS